MTIKEAIEVNCRDGGWFRRSGVATPTNYLIDGDGNVESDRNGRKAVWWSIELCADDLTAEDWVNAKEPA